MEVSKSSEGSKNGKNGPDLAASKNLRSMAQSMGTIYQSIRETSFGPNKVVDELESKPRKEQKNNL